MESNSVEQSMASTSAEQVSSFAVPQTDQPARPENIVQKERVDAERAEQQKAAFALVEKALADARTQYSEALRTYSSFEEFSAFKSQAMITSARLIHRVAYSDRMAWILSVMSGLVYINFEDTLEEVARLKLNLRGGGF